MDKVKRFLGKPPQQGSFKVNRVNGQTLDSDADNKPLMLPPPQPKFSKNPPRILVIGAGSRGTSNAYATVHASNGVVAAVAEPVESKRKHFGRRFIWGPDGPKEGEEFEGWRGFLEWETKRRESRKEVEESDELGGKGIDGVVICTLDKTHLEIIDGLAPLNLHIMCEKPLATSLDDCLKVYRLLRPKGREERSSMLVAIGHIMRYSPYNMLLRKLLLEDEAVGDVVSVDHMESVGWWHFAHSYVRGNWRKESVTAPTLLTKSCHDIDFLMWLLCSPQKAGQGNAHLPSTVTGTGSLVHFKRSRKPAKAQDATNCLSCPIETECQYSAKKIYHEKGILQNLGGWPVDVVLPDIEDHFENLGLKGTEKKLMEVLAEDYDKAVIPEKEIENRQWYGRCVYESDNDVCDDQTVTISWEEEPANSGESAQSPRGAKTANFHMTAFSEPICKHRTHIYGTKGEIEGNSIESTITVRNFATGEKKVHKPHLSGGSHSGGSFGLMRQFVLAIDAVKSHGMAVEEAQRVHIGCTVEEIIRNHAMVFAAEEARVGKRVVHWGQS
ncbi:hypothetical protein FQN54_002944 [Arachnomyces sp. PD_36]|nr:hypothetical protein FQN54_002944 [Arachnomyces sp. PD_36]